VVEERAGVDGVRRVHAESKETIAVEVERELDRHGGLVVAGALQAEVVDPGGILEGFVSR